MLQSGLVAGHRLLALGRVQVFERCSGRDSRKGLCACRTCCCGLWGRCAGLGLKAVEEVNL